MYNWYKAKKNVCLKRQTFYTIISFSYVNIICFLVHMYRFFHWCLQANELFMAISYIIYVKFICKRSYMVSLFYLLVFISLLYLFSLEFNDFNCLHKLIVNGDFILFLFETTKLKILNCIEWSCVIFSKTINRFKAIFKCLFHYIF